jgi:hypothetical protein
MALEWWNRRKKKRMLTSNSHNQATVTVTYPRRVIPVGSPRADRNSGAIHTAPARPRDAGPQLPSGQKGLRDLRSRSIMRAAISTGL